MADEGGTLSTGPGISLIDPFAQPGTAGGTDGQLQYNDNGTLNGTPFFEFDDANNDLLIGDTVLQTLQQVPVQTSAITTGGIMSLEGLAVVDEIMYAVDEGANALFILDISAGNASSPEIISFNVFTELDVPHDIVVEYPFAYVTNTGDDMLVVFDISNRATPVFLASVATTGSPFQLIIQSHFCYIANPVANTVDVIDVTNPRNPVIADSLTDATNLLTVRGLAAQGNQLITVGDGIIASFDITDPNNLSFNSSTANVALGGGFHVEISGVHAYVASSTGNAVSIWGIEDPGALVLEGSEAVGEIDDAKHLEVSGNNLYVTTGGASPELAVVDITDHTNPVFLFAVSQTSPEFLRSSGRMLYLCDGLNLKSFDIHGAQFVGIDVGTVKASIGAIAQRFDVGGNLTVKGSINAGSGINTRAPFATSNSIRQKSGQDPAHIASVTTLTPRRVRAVGRLIYMSSATSIHVIEQEGNTLTELDSIVVSGGTPQRFSVGAGYLYTSRSTGTGGLSIIDIRNPSNLVEVGTLAAGGTMRTMAVEGRYAYSASFSTNLLNIYDIADPINPQLLSTTSMSGLGASLTGVNQIQIQNGHLLVLSSTLGAMGVFNVLDPGNVTLEDYFVDSVLDGAADFVISGPVAYVTGSTGDSVSALDISDYNNLAVLSTLVDTTLLDDPRGIDVAGNVAYVTMSATDRMSVVDITDPSNMAIVGTFSDTGIIENPVDISVIGRRAFVTSDDTLELVMMDIFGCEFLSADIGSIVTSRVVIDGTLDVNADVVISGGANIAQSLQARSVSSESVHYQGRVMIPDQAASNTATLSDVPKAIYGAGIVSQSIIFTLSDATKAFASPTNPWQFSVVDEQGQLSMTDFIDITPESGTIGGAAALRLETAFGAAIIYCDGTNFLVIQS